MTLPPTNGKKLTWDPIFPAPFESGWSIFSKLVALNNINLNELRNLIQREDAMGRNLTLLDCSDSSWIDFERFSILLDVDERRLKDGFWDQLGITPKITSRYEVRRCPQCWELGYHCLLFDLSILSSCPWHRCPLTKSCAGCAFPTTFAIRTADGIRNSRFCPRCGTTLRSFTSLISLKRISRHDAAMIIGYCREFIDWWQLVGEKIPARDLILADILHIGSDTLETQKSSAWQIGYVFSGIGDM